MDELSFEPVLNISEASSKDVSQNIPIWCDHAALSNSILEQKEVHFTENLSEDEVDSSFESVLNLSNLAISDFDSPVATSSPKKKNGKAVICAKEVSMDCDMYHFTADDGDVPHAFHVSLDESVGSCDDSSDAFSNLPTSK